MPPVHPYPMIITFTSLTSLTAGKEKQGGKIIVRNRRTKDTVAVDGTAKTTTTVITAVNLENTGQFPNGYVNGDVIEVSMGGLFFGNGSHTINTTTKGGGKLNIAVTAVTISTHPNTTL